MNTHPNIQNRHDNNISTLYVQNKEDNNQNPINNNTNNLNNLNNNYDVTITADITMESNWNTQWQLESTQDITYVPQTHTHTVKILITII